MTPGGILVILSPLVFLLARGALKSRWARRLALWVPLPWLLAILPAIWMSSDCRSVDLAYLDCAWTGPGLAEALSAIALAGTATWPLVVPFLLLALGVLELRHRR